MSKCKGAGSQEKDAKAPERQDQQPQNPQEFMEALRKRGFKVNVWYKALLNARRDAELESEGWHGNQNLKNKK